MGLVCLVSVFLILAGIAVFRRKWPLNGWVTGVLAAIFLIGLAVTIPLAADAAPQVDQRYQALMHTAAVKNIHPFNKVVTSGDVDIAYISSPDYAVTIRYADHPNLSKVKSTLPMTRYTSIPHSLTLSIIAPCFACTRAIT